MALPKIKLLVDLVLVAGIALLTVAGFFATLAYAGSTEAISPHEGGTVRT